MVQILYAAQFEILCEVSYNGTSTACLNSTCWYNCSYLLITCNCFLTYHKICKRKTSWIEVWGYSFFSIFPDLFVAYTGTVKKQKLFSKNWTKFHMLWSLMREVYWKLQFPLIIRNFMNLGYFMRFNSRFYTTFELIQFLTKINQMNNS